MTRKNILFLFPDQHRGDWMPYPAQVLQELGLPQLPLRMEHIRSLMEQGTTFTRAATNSPLCVPARACLASGQDYERCGAWNNDFCYPLSKPTFYGVLKQGGYQVAGVGKFDLHKPVRFWGAHGWIPQLGQLGFTSALENEGKGDAVWAWQHGIPGPYGMFLRSRGLMEAYCADHARRAGVPTDAEPFDIPQDAYADDWVTDNALAALRTLTQQSDPWFLMVNFSGPHDPWDVTVPMKRRWEHTVFPLPQDAPDALMGVRQNYAAMLENIDRNIGRLLAALEASGQLENTVVIYAADHGEMLGDRGRYFKSVPDLPAVHIPLVISGGGVRRGAVCGELVQLNDLAATIVDFAGLSMPEGTDARSLRPLASCREAPPIRTHQYAALYPRLPAPAENRAGYEAYEDCCKPAGNPTRKAVGWRSILTKEYQYIVDLESGRRELYSLREAAPERKNLAEAYPEICAELQALIDSRTQLKQ